MTNTPEKAVARARADKMRRVQEQTAEADRKSRYPALAAAHMQMFADAISDAVPEGFVAHIAHDDGTLLGDRGVNGVIVAFKDGDRVLSRGRIAASRDETIVTEIAPPEGDSRSSVRSSDAPFHDFDEKDAVAVLTSMIETYGI